MFALILDTVLIKMEESIKINECLYLRLTLHVFILSSNNLLQKYLFRLSFESYNQSINDWFFLIFSLVKFNEIMKIK